MKRVAINEWAEPNKLLPRLRIREVLDCEELDLNRNLLGPEGMRGLAKMQFPRLLALELFANRIGDKGAGHLATASFVRQLNRLGLGGEYRFGMDNNIGDEGFVTLLPKLVSIVDLELGFNHGGARALSALDHCPTLKKLGLSTNRFGNAGARTLAATNLRLDTLDLSENQITAEGMLDLARSGILQSLREVSFTRNRFGDDGAKYVAMSMLRPRRLEMNECAIGDAGAVALASSPVLTHVETLGLGDNHIGEEGLAALVKSPYLTNLRSLCFRNNVAGPKYTPWLDWDGSEQGSDFDSEHARRIEAMFGGRVDVH